MAAAPAESTCSHSGIFTCGPARLTTAMTSGARASRVRSASACSGVACGYLARNADTIAAPAAVRASPSKMMKRQGTSLPWSGTRAATVSSVSISAAEGAGPASSIGLIERLVLRSSRASGMGVFVAGLRLAQAGQADKPPPPRHEFAAIAVETLTHGDGGDEVRPGGPTRCGRSLVACGTAGRCQRPILLDLAERRAPPAQRRARGAARSGAEPLSSQRQHRALGAEEPGAAIAN